jgi:hypothetical protein
VITRRLLIVLATLSGLGLLNLLCAPQTKTLDCKPAQTGSSALQAGSSGDVDPSLDLIERFSLDSSRKQIVFPGGKEVKAERVSYRVSGNVLSFEDRFGGRFELNLNTGTLRSFVRAGPVGPYRLGATATCSGL